MGSIIELNDTLQITREQGFPEELHYESHLKKPLTSADFKGRIFTFQNKSGIRVYHTAPVRCFLVENINGKWLYWGLIHMLEVTHDNVKKTTSGKYKIVYLYTPTEMPVAHQFIDHNKETSFFNN